MRRSVRSCRLATLRPPMPTPRLTRRRSGLSPRVQGGVPGRPTVGAAPPPKSCLFAPDRLGVGRLGRYHVRSADGVSRVGRCAQVLDTVGGEIASPTPPPPVSGVAAVRGKPWAHREAREKRRVAPARALTVERVFHASRRCRLPHRAARCIFM